MGFFYKHGVSSIADKWGVTEAAVEKAAALVASVGGFDEKKVVKILWAAKSPSVKELLKYLEEMPEPPEEADQLDPFELKLNDRTTAIHSPQAIPAGQGSGLFNAPAGEALWSQKLD